MYTYNRRTNKISYNSVDLNDTETIKYINEYLIVLKQQLQDEYTKIKENYNDSLLNSLVILKKIHLLEANKAVIELKTIFNFEFANIVSQQLSIQYSEGIGSKGNRFGLIHLLTKSESLSENEIKESLRKYSNSGSLSYYKIIEQSKLSSGFRFSRRFLKNGNNCPDCIDYAEQGLQLIGYLPVPTEKCFCNTNCKCTIEYYE